MNIKIYEGRFGYEQFLFDMNNYNLTPNKGDFIYYGEEGYEEIYIVLYIMLDINNDEYNVFVRKAIEEDF